MATRDLNAARQAFASGDIRASIRAHTRPSTNGQCAPSSNAACAGQEPGHECSDDSTRSAAAFGSFEGVAVATAVVAAGKAIQLTDEQCITLALTCVCGIAVAVFARDYIRLIAYAQHYAHERQREQWELSSFREGEIREMVELYEGLGIPKTDAETIMNTLSKHEQCFVDLMMDQELKLARPCKTPLLDAAATMVSFALFGAFTTGVYAACTVGVAALPSVPALAPAIAFFQARPWMCVSLLPLLARVVVVLALMQLSLRRGGSLDALPFTATSATAWLTALWTTLAWTAVTAHVFSHRKHGWWLQLCTLATSCTVALLVALVGPVVYPLIASKFASHR